MRIDRVKFTAELKRRDITQKELADSSGVSRTTINGIAAGRRCSDEVAEKIADALGVDLETLIVK